ncbi:hypothetical protein AVEN_149116-1 [Araneus ventricosus]|uniref:Transposase domain-containing protein n=1 Tax=Araneus ventricosus TaxID=182803 RepID=A0A4Y1ZUM9_ARAVE|nr:hypothetical protein AVEN_149116-1 [Araneus ventricosus]
MMKCKLSKRQRDLKLKKAVDEHMKDIMRYESRQDKNEDMIDTDFHGTSENISISIDSSEEDSDNQSSSSTVYDSDYMDKREDSETKIEMDAMSNINSQNVSNLANELRTCFIKHNVTHTFINDVLQILGKHHDLPKDARTLLDTPGMIETKDLNNGQYVHFGIHYGLEKQLTLLENLSTIKLSFNIDGLPLFKSSSQQAWPILCLVNNIQNSKPFVIGIFSGHSKPDNVSKYLFDFIQDVKELLQNPVIGGKTFEILIDAFICDAPARSYLKCIKNHNGYFGCERCTQKGKWLGRMTFSELNSPKRKDEDFSNRINVDSPDEHIINPSPLLDINVGLVSMFPLDYMHLVCLGVVRKLILAWYKGSLRIRLSSSAKTNLNQSLVDCSKYSPKEFQRKPRSLIEIDSWKATEFRCFLLYVGPVVLKDILLPDYYNHFLCLHLAIRIMLNEKLIEDYLDYAEELLCYFVKHCKTLYGEEFVVYNVHSLVHLAEDVRRYGSLNNISAFPFESYLGRMKKLLRTPHKPLQQICKRLLESKDLYEHKIVRKHTVIPLASSLHFSGPTLKCQGVQYKEIEGHNFKLKVKLANNCIMLKNDKIILAQNFICKENQLFIIGQEFLHKTSFYSKPCESSTFKIYNVSCLSPLNCWSVNEFLCKGILLPYKTSNVFLPLLHCYANFY